MLQWIATPPPELTFMEFCQICFTFHFHFHFSGTCQIYNRLLLFTFTELICIGLSTKVKVHLCVLSHWLGPHMMVLMMMVKNNNSHNNNHTSVSHWLGPHMNWSTPSEAADSFTNSVLSAQKMLSQKNHLMTLTTVFVGHLLLWLYWASHGQSRWKREKS